MKIFKFTFIYKKHDTLCYVKKISYKNPDTSKKAGQYGLRFYIKKS